MFSPHVSSCESVRRRGTQEEEEEVVVGEEEGGQEEGEEEEKSRADIRRRKGNGGREEQGVYVRGGGQVIRGMNQEENEEGPQGCHTGGPSTHYCIYLHIEIHTHKYIYTHTQMYIYVYTHIYIHRLYRQSALVGRTLGSISRRRA